MTRKNETREYSSPACFMHEAAAPAAPKPEDWDEIKTWRRVQRKELIARRLGKNAAERERLAAPIIRHLLDSITESMYPVLGIYWPIRGEIDLRELARRHIEAGGVVGLPVVVRQAAPVEFWRWRPGVAMRRGLWNIPIPPVREIVEPSVLIVPLVGFDRAHYRLGYGGGFYDRTLAAAAPRPHTIGVGYADAELPTIYPRPHDIPMDVIVTDQFTLDAADAGSRTVPRPGIDPS
jgi:5-formyltetrahydrofolate cyclo-ligase